MSRASERQGGLEADRHEAPSTSAPSDAHAIDALLETVGPPLAAPDVKQTYGVVEAMNDGVYAVRVAEKSLKAKRAASCLLEPSVGDQVLVAVTDKNRSFVLAVLVQGEREQKGGVVSIDGDLTLRAKTGKVSVVANDAVTITSATKIAIQAPELAAHALRTTFFSESLSYIGRKIESEVEHLKVVAQVVDRTIDRVSERIKRSYRTIEGIEHVKAKELDVVVEGNVSIHSDNTVLSADKLVKVDGEQIHLG